MKATLSTIIALAAAFATAQGARPHPKLLIDASSSRPAVNAFETKVQSRLVQEADWVMRQPVEGYSLVQNSLLTTSRDAVAHILTLSAAYRQTGDIRYADRAKTQMLTSAEFPNWFPAHFLGTAEMTFAMAIGYDWLNDTLTAGEKQTIRTAIVEKGLKPGLQQFTGRADWTRKGTNWSQVCGGSLAMAAIAVQADEPQIAARILTLSIPAVNRAARDYKPNGIPSEGPVYWRYGMAFHTMLNRAMTDNFGSRKAMLRDKAFAETAWYPVYVLAPSGKNFNFGDASDWFVPTPATLELARATNQPQIAWWTEQRVNELLEQPQRWVEEHRLSALFAVWNREGSGTAPTSMPLDRTFKGKVEIASMRESWTNPNSAFVGIKAGLNGVPHGQLDLGSFVYEANGVRWGMDLGKDSYSLPGYFSKERFSYYRNSTVSHNTLNFGGNQATGGSVRMTSTLNTASPTVLLDLTRPYSGAAQKITRQFDFLNRRDLLITDTVTRATRAWRWQMVTGASVTIQGHQAILEQNGQKLLLEVASTSAGQIAVVSTNPGDARQNQNNGTQMIVVTAPAGTTTLRVLLRPL